MKTILASAVLMICIAPAYSGAPTSGELLYSRGILPSGESVAGERVSGGASSGADAACTSCHRRSGLGTIEGRTVIPAITAKYLFRTGVRGAQQAVARQNMRSSVSRSPYTDVTLARAIREGIDPDGRTLDYLMPRYSLDDAAMNSLIEYLKQLSSSASPGVTEDTLHFATIITPDADPIKRKGMLDVLEHFFASKNAFYRGTIPAFHRVPLMTYHIPRKWQLHVWELAGAPETWKAQLRSRFEAEPVFAAISGLGGRNWTPVHQFCQEESLPCLFPNVELPVVAEGDFYNIYFSQGVLLEAGLIEKEIRDRSGSAGLQHVVQIFRQDDIGAGAARAFRDGIAAPGIEVIQRPLASRASAGDLQAALAGVKDRDAVVLWLRPDDLRILPADPPKSPLVVVSGLMAGMETAPITGAWRDVVHMAYPFELPAKRAVPLNYSLRYFSIQHIPVVAEQTQIDTYTACGILAENLENMLENFVRDYLVENIEVMLSTKTVNGYYHRLGLAPGQRFASKGGYIVRFDGGKVIPEGNWIVP